MRRFRGPGKKPRKPKYIPVESDPVILVDDLAISLGHNPAEFRRRFQCQHGGACCRDGCLKALPPGDSLLLRTAASWLAINMQVCLIAPVKASPALRRDLKSIGGAA
jgi:hypothetical protein